MRGSVSSFERYGTGMAFFRFFTEYRDRGVTSVPGVAMLGPSRCAMALQEWSNFLGGWDWFKLVNVREPSGRTDAAGAGTRPAAPTDPGLSEAMQSMRDRGRRHSRGRR